MDVMSLLAGSAERALLWAGWEFLRVVYALVSQGFGSAAHPECVIDAVSSTVACPR
ncbi:hypothetical protein [Nocardia huaxiensis]|uniref:Uncharacterized protein n=1 Tax=Nocardia huaxiensis TaxID=2755382 RepID=A0A7D6Z0Q0_9NOCA|nr:hypothetical protein [Nocardia huaxiensis]QLY29526.1 hypothetical protein H0264_30385 [Nocardia huaxiensis]UFS96916.1 hypothetical protein LPY97_03000 [Nocardia huaxiensis]